MRARLKACIDISDDRIILMGTEVNIINMSETSGTSFVELPGGEKAYINNNLLDIIDYSPIIDWEQRRYEIAKTALHAFCSHRQDHRQYMYSNVQDAISIADILIEELKKNDKTSM